MPSSYERGRAKRIEALNSARASQAFEAAMRSRHDKWRRRHVTLTDEDQWLSKLLGAEEIAKIAGAGRADTIRRLHPDWDFKWRKSISKRWRIHAIWSLSCSGLSRDEIAETMGTTPGSVNVYLWKMRRRAQT